MITEPVWADAVAAHGIGGTVSDEVDVAIVGAGFAGLSAALHLAGAFPAIRVVVLEGGMLGTGASGRNTGMLTPGVGQSLPALARRLGEADAGVLYRATLDAVAGARALIEREGIDCQLEMSGQLVLARSAADRRRLDRVAALMRRLELPVQVLNDDALAGALCVRPAPGDSTVGPTALRLPNAGILHPGRLLAGLASACVRRGVPVRCATRVERVDGGTSNEPVCLTLADGRLVRAARAVIATAGYTPGLGVLRGRVLPVQLQAMATAPLPTAVRRALRWQGREGVVEARRVFNYFRLTRDDRIVFGGGAPQYRWGGRVTAPAAAAVAAAARLHAALVATFGGAAADVPREALAPTHAWTGTIGYVADAIPVIGPLPGRPRITHVGGWCGHGIALSLASGAWVARLLRDSAAASSPLPWFRGSAPWIPSEVLRWTAFRASVATMSVLDRFA